MEQFFNLEYLNTFIVAAETRKLNITSEIVYRSHSAVSIQIKKLEEQIGLKLFIRNKDMLTLTKHGEILLVHAKEILEKNSLIFHYLRSNNWSETIDFGVPTDYANFFIYSIHPLLKKILPDIKFNISCSRSRKIRGLIAEGKIQLAIIAMEPQYPDEILLWEEPLYWASSKDFIIPKKSPLPIALFSDDCVVNTYTLYCLKRSKIDHEIIFRSTISDNIENAVENGIAVSLLPFSSITKNMKILPNDFINCPFKLQIGVSFADHVDRQLLNIIVKTLKTCINERNGIF